jgi:hypothetical protein
MLEALLTDPLAQVLVAIYVARKAILLRELLALRNEWVRRDR